MKRDQTYQRPEPDLPLREKVWCGIILTIALIALGWICAQLVKT